MRQASDPGSIQDAQYRFPYHYLPRLEDGRFRFHEVLGWGHEYLAYMSHVADLAAARDWRSLIDIGCGDGRLVSILAQRFPERRVVGVDQSERAVALARALAPAGRFVAGDVTRPDLFPEPFDAATCVETIEHVAPDLLPAFVRGIRRQLREGGVLIVTVPSINVALNPKHFQHFTAETLSATLSGPFEVEDTYHINGSSAGLELLRRALTNRFYTVTSPALLTAFYRFYLKRFLRSDAKRGSRIVAICRAAGG